MGWPFDIGSLYCACTLVVMDVVPPLLSSMHLIAVLVVLLVGDIMKFMMPLET